MAINITVKDANKDGKGIDFAAYLASYNNTFTREGYGGFNSSDPMAMSGTQYSTNDANKYGVVLTSGSTAWNYNMSTHQISGSLDAVEFGSAVRFNATTSRFNLTSDVKISGLGITDTALGGQILGDLMGGKTTTGGATTSLTNVLNANSILFTGSTGADKFTGYALADTINGGAGNDTLSGAGGNDRITGGAGNDHLLGNVGDDALLGGDGNDIISGGTGNDRLYGDAGNDTLKGDNGNDRLSAHEGNDTLDGGAGNDELYGGAGNDTLDGGTGNDILSGGSGSDTFIFKLGQGNDTITDFQAGSAVSDVIQLAKSAFANFSAVLSHATDTDGGVEIAYGSNTILLAGVEKAELHANDFLFA